MFSIILKASRLLANSSGRELTQHSTKRYIFVGGGREVTEHIPCLLYHEGEICSSICFTYVMSVFKGLFYIIHLNTAGQNVLSTEESVC